MATRGGRPDSGPVSRSQPRARVWDAPHKGGTAADVHESRRTVNAPAASCLTYPNTATLVETGQSATAKLAPGTTLNAGYDFTIPGNNTTRTFTINNPRVVFTLHCVSGATPSQTTVTAPMSTTTTTVNDSGWYPSGDQHSPLVYQGTVAVPNVCGGGQVRLDAGGTFTTNVTVNGPGPAAA